MRAVRTPFTASNPKYFWPRLTSIALVMAVGSLATYGIAARRSEPKRPAAVAGATPLYAPIDTSAANESTTTSPPRSGTAPGTQVDKRGLHIVAFTFYDNGIEPDTVHTSKGPIAILLEDRSGGTKGLVLERETGSVRVGVGQVNRADPTSPTPWRGRTEFNLGPGTYRVTDSSRPLNFAELIVDP
jgi:hypothetical protein